MVAGRVGERAVAHPVRLVDRLLVDLDAVAPKLFERRVDVGGDEDEARHDALAGHLDRGLDVDRGAAGAARQQQADLEVGLGRAADGQPAHAAEVDVVAHLEAEYVAVERQRGVLVVDGEEAVSDGEFHG